MTKSKWLQKFKASFNKYLNTLTPEELRRLELDRKSLLRVIRRQLKRIRKKQKEWRKTNGKEN